MNKKLKKMLAAVSAVAVCAVSMVSVSAGAIYIENPGVTQYTTSFKIDDTKYVVWQEMNDYYDTPNYKFFISEDGKANFGLHYNTIFTWGWYGYDFENEEDLVDFKNYFEDNNLEYKESSYPVSYDELTSTWLQGTKVQLVVNAYTNYEYLQLISKIKEDTGLKQGLISPANLVFYNVTDVVNELPEPTLLGDTDCDGSVNINDAILVMQAIANPDKYKLSEQGKANADVVGDGNGITNSDALAIQEIAATHEYD